MLMASSGCAAVSSAPPSLWLRNIQLSTASAAIAACPLACSLLPFLAAAVDAAGSAAGGAAGSAAGSAMLAASLDQRVSNPFRGIDLTAFLLIPAWGGLGGVLVALVLKHANSILRGFATATATIVATGLSVLVLGFQPSPTFGAGAALVVLSMITYAGCTCSRPAAAQPEPFSTCLDATSAHEPSCSCSVDCERAGGAAHPTLRHAKLRIHVSDEGGIGVPGGDDDLCESGAETAPLKRSQTPRRC